MPRKYVESQEKYCVLLDLENIGCRNSPILLARVLRGICDWLWLRSKGQIDSRYCIAYVQRCNTRSAALLRRLCRDFGFKLIITEGIVDDQLKKDLDTALRVNSLPDVVFLVSGDGDFIDDVVRIRTFGDRQAFIIAPRGCTSPGLRMAGNGYIELQSLLTGVA